MSGDTTNMTGDFPELDTPAEFDGNAWYSISELRVEKVGESLGSTLQITDNGMRVFPMVQNHWQMQSVDDIPGRYLMRYEGTGVGKQLSACRRNNERSRGKTQTCMEDASKSEDQQWQIEHWGDGSLKIYNIANGTDYQLDVHPGADLFLNHEIMNKTSEAYFPAQHWVFSSMSEVNDGAYSTIYGDESSTASSAEATPSSESGKSTPSASASSTDPAASSATNPSANNAPGASTTASGADVTGDPVNGAEGAQNSSGSNSGDSSDSDSSGLTTGAAAGIGVGATLAVIGLLGLIFFIWRKKRNGRSTKISQVDDSIDGGAGGSMAAQGYYSTNPNDAPPMSKSGAPSSGPGTDYCAPSVTGATGAEKDVHSPQVSVQSPPEAYGANTNTNAYGNYPYEAPSQQIHEAPVQWHAELDGAGPQPGSGMNSVQNTPAVEFSRPNGRF